MAFKSYDEALQYLIEHPEAKDQLFSLMPKLEQLYNIYLANQQYGKGEIDANTLLGQYGQNSAGGAISMSPETEKWLDNQIARENATTQYDREIAARDTSLLSAGNQLSQLGLSTSNVIQTGGASSGVQASNADTAMRSNSALRQQMKINKFNQQMSLAKSLIGAASSMASSGIYGSAIGAVKHSAQAIAGSAAHSGLAALKATKMSASDNAQWDAFVKDSAKANRAYNKKANDFLL